MTNATSTSRHFAIFGKVRSKGDFVRHRTESASARAASRFIEAAVDHLHDAGLTELDAPVRFEIADASSSVVAVGVAVPSADASGRKHPLVACCELDTAPFRDAPGAMSLACEPALDRAQRLLARASDVPFEQLVHDADALSLPTSGEADAARTTRSTWLSEELASTVEARLFATHGHRAYALVTIVKGLSRARAEPSGGVMLDCHGAHPMDRLVFAELVARRAHPRGVLVSKAYAEGASHSVISLGTASPKLLRAALATHGTIDELWPLTTTRERALSRAEESIPNGASAFPAPGASLERLIDAADREMKKLDPA